MISINGTEFDDDVEDVEDVEELKLKMPGMPNRPASATPLVEKLPVRGVNEQLPPPQ